MNLEKETNSPDAVDKAYIYDIVYHHIIDDMWWHGKMNECTYSAIQIDAFNENGEAM